MIARGRIAHTVVDGVAENAAPAKIRHRHPELVAVALQMIIEVEEPHAGLDERVGGFVVHLEHAIHASQAQHYAARHARRGAAVAVVAALRARPERHPVLVGDSQDGLDLLDRSRQ